MTLLIDDPVFDQFAEAYLLALDIAHKYGEALRAVAGGHDSYDTPRYRVVLCPGEVLVRGRDG